MECNKDEAIRAQGIAETLFSQEDFDGAKRFLLKAKRLFPDLEGLDEMLNNLEVLTAAQSKVGGTETDWYGILQVDSGADDKMIRRQYRKLAKLVHPDKNKFMGAEVAFKWINDAFNYLSDPEKRGLHDRKTGVHAGVPQEPVTMKPKIPNSQAPFNAPSAPPTPNPHQPLSPTDIHSRAAGHGAGWQERTTSKQPVTPAVDGATNAEEIRNEGPGAFSGPFPGSGANCSGFFSSVGVASAPPDVHPNNLPEDGVQQLYGKRTRGLVEAEKENKRMEEEDALGRMGRNQRQSRDAQRLSTEKSRMAKTKEFAIMAQIKRKAADSRVRKAVEHARKEACLWERRKRHMDAQKRRNPKRKERDSDHEHEDRKESKTGWQSDLSSPKIRRKYSPGEMMDGAASKVGIDESSEDALRAQLKGDANAKAAVKAQDFGVGLVRKSQGGTMVDREREPEDEGEAGHALADVAVNIVGANGRGTSVIFFFCRSVEKHATLPTFFCRSVEKHATLPT